MATMVDIPAGTISSCFLYNQAKTFTTRRGNVENSSGEVFAKIEKLESRMSKMEAMIIQLYRLYYELALNLSEVKNKSTEE
jgi:hypothetical protein